MMAALIVAWIAASVVVMAYGWRQASKYDETPENDLQVRRRYNTRVKNTGRQTGEQGK